MMRYKLPTKKQILFLWDVKPTAKVVALIIQDWADERMEDISDKAYNNMPQTEREEFHKNQLGKAKITVSIRELAEISNASRGGVNAALDDLQEKGFVESNRPKRGKGVNERKEYYYRLHQGNQTSYKRKT
jgi:DNA-binding GntR family transcriptional regulator